MNKLMFVLFGLFCVSCASNNVKTADSVKDPATRKIAQAKEETPINAHFEFSPNSSNKIRKACRDAGFVGAFHFYTNGQSENSQELNIAQINFQAPVNQSVYPHQNAITLTVIHGNGNLWHLDPGAESTFIDFDHSILWVPLKDGFCEGTFTQINH